jgi:uncharacterized membrane protein YsdA (DUF1294 family)
MKKLPYWLGIYVIVSLLFGLLGAGCENSLHREKTFAELFEVCIISGFSLTTSIILLFATLFLLSYLFQKATEKP